MEKVWQILAVFVLMMLIINRFIRGIEPGYRGYDFLTRTKAPLAAEITQRLITAVFDAEHQHAMLVDDERQLRFAYLAEGSLTIYWRAKERQCLAAPINCTAIALDPDDGRLYLEAEGFIFVYGR